MIQKLFDALANHWHKSDSILPLNEYMGISYEEYKVLLENKDFSDSESKIYKLELELREVQDKLKMLKPHYLKPHGFQYNLVKELREYALEKIKERK